MGTVLFMPQLISDVSGWGYAIQKQECANHAIKCFRSSSEKLVKDKPQYKGRGKLTEQMRKRLASSVRCAIINRSKLTNKNSSPTSTERYTKLCTALLW